MNRSDEPRERVPYGTTIATARRLLEERGALSTWELTSELSGADAGHALLRLKQAGTAVQVRGSSLYALPRVAKAIEAAISAALQELA